MTRQTIGAPDLKRLLDETIRRDGAASDGARDYRIVPADPATSGGANWTLMPDGAEPFSDAVERVQAHLKERFDLKGDA